MEIVIINQPLNNRGDEAAHKSLIRSLNKEFKEAIINIIFVGSNQNSINQFTIKNSKNSYINIQAFKWHGPFVRIGLKYNLLKLFCLIHPSHRKVAKLIKTADVVICAPGGVCMGPYQNWGHLWFLRLALNLNKKLVYYSRSFGPFPITTKNQRTFRRISINTLKRIDFLSLRDNVSQSYADDLNLRYIKSIDTAFLDTPKVEIPENLNTEIGKCYIVFVPNELTWHPQFKNIDITSLEIFYLSIIRLLLDARKDVNIVMLPQLFNYKNGNDIDYFRLLYKKIGNPRVKVISDQYSSDIQQAIISKSLYLIGARYHSVVFSINNQIPFTALSYEHKISGLLEMLELNSNLIDLSFFLETNEEKRNHEITNALREVKKRIENSLFQKQKYKLEQARETAIICKKELVQFVEHLPH